MKTLRRSDLWKSKRSACVVAACDAELDGESGSALIEMAFIVAFLGVPMLIGTAEMALMVHRSIEVSDAAAAGAAYGMQSSTLATDNTDMIAAARADALDFPGTTLAVTPTTYYACSLAMGGTQYATLSAATSACTGTYNRALEFVKVTTSATLTPPFHCPGLPSTITLNAQSVREVEQ